MLGDVLMSIDNILAVAAIGRDDTQLLIFGLVLAIAIPAIASFIKKFCFISPASLCQIGISYALGSPHALRRRGRAKANKRLGSGNL